MYRRFRANIKRQNRIFEMTTTNEKTVLTLYFSTIQI